MSSQNLKSIGISVLLALAPVILLRFGMMPAYDKNKAVFDLALYLPYFLAGLVALLGFRLNSTRIFFVSLAMILAYALLTSVSFNALVLLKHEHRAGVATLALPLSMVIVFALGERRLMSRHGLMKLGATVLPFALLILALRLELTGAAGLLEWTAFKHPPGLRIADASLVAFVAFGIAAALFRDRYIQFFSLSCFVALLSLYFAFNEIMRNPSSRLSVNLIGMVTFSAAGLILLYAIFRIYWQKVYIDELTGVPNRRALDESLRKLGQTFSIAMVDIDHFKKFNDTYGHEQGDHVLRLVAMHFDRESGHRLYRYGGEEFCLLYDAERATDIAERVDGMRESLASRDFYIRKPEADRKQTSAEDRGKEKDPGIKIRITVSMGLSGSRPGRERSPIDVIRDADEALYAAKKAGRNQVGLTRET